MRVRKTLEMAAWPCRFNIPFFHFPVSGTSKITAGLMEELLLKINTSLLNSLASATAGLKALWTGFWSFLKQH